VETAYYCCLLLLSLLSKWTRREEKAEMSGGGGIISGGGIDKLDHPSTSTQQDDQEHRNFALQDSNFEEDNFRCTSSRKFGNRSAKDRNRKPISPVMVVLHVHCWPPLPTNPRSYMTPGDQHPITRLMEDTDRISGQHRRRVIRRQQLA
jgi:hypothetical protein